MYRVYKKAITANAPTDYTTDGMGALCEICVKQYTLPAVAANASIVIGIAPSKVNIQTFSVLSHMTSTGATANAATTTYVLSTSADGNSTILTIAVPNGGTAIPANSVLQVLYTVGA